MFAVGASTSETIDVGVYLVGQFLVLAVQITAHYLNEYADFEADRLIENRTIFSGGSGILSDGLLERSVALRAGQVTTAVSLGAIVAVSRFSLPAATLGLVALGVSWSYSMPPARLVSSGLGEIAVSLVVAGAVPLVGSLVQSGTQSATLWWSIAILVPIHFAMILSFELPDAESDAVAGKTVLAVRIGRSSTVRLIAASLVLAAAVAGLGATIGGLSQPGVLVFGLIPMTLTVFGLRRRSHQMLTISAVATLVVVALALMVGSGLNGSGS
jgi:1,4-dihydroxy-2-naphthoate octaprenyltransferase